ncbi:pentapeptide repeat-containing protein [Agrilactobacillus fermenti]|uniref:pentapeptide repeat-containing protein n=1 Tax=Agrilactobacillus fermenti TaxID=2586909 RepID=UPI003A5C1D7E
MIENQQLALDQVIAEESYINCQFITSNRKTHFSDLTFEHCHFEQTDFTDTEWLDCHFVDIDFANKNFDQSAIYRCNFQHCQLVGTQFEQSRWQDCHIEASKGDYVNFSDSRLTKVVFDNVRLSEAFFQAVQIKKLLQFKNCELMASDFSDTILKDVNLSSSEISGLRVDPKLIAGLKISPFQATQFVQLLGVQIKS